MSSQVSPNTPRAASSETVEGTVERQVFANPENGWAVLRVRVEGRREPITAVGSLFGLQPGKEVRLQGHWQQDARFGRQFQVESHLELDPSTLEGLRRYLGSGLVPGIGREMARRLVERFGMETLEVIANSPERLLEVDGVGPVRTQKIREAWAEQRDLQEALVFLQGHGLSVRQAIKAHRHLGEGTVAAVRTNPYRLATEIFGIGFHTSDRIAASLGISGEDPARLRAGLLHELGRAAEEGHVFLPRDQLLSRTSGLLEVPEERLSRALVDHLEEGTLVAEGGEAIYRPDLHAAERQIAREALRLLQRPSDGPPIDVDRALQWVESREKIRLGRRQREAIRQALTSKLLIVTGGPGTGKTTLVRSVLRILERKGLRILLAAPTGRAANRLGELAGTEARTVHRLLEFDPSSLSFQRHRGRPLEADLVIVDEASMLDCFLAASLLAAVPDPGRLLLVGDVDQLPSVGPGAVLAQLIQSARAPVVVLDQIYRQAARSLIVRNAHRVRQGEMPSLRHSPEADFFFIERHRPEEVLETLLHLAHERVPRSFGFSPREDIQVLTPMRRGLLGADNLNRELQVLLNSTGEPLREGFRLRIGDRVMQIRNNYDLDVFNGEVGQILGPHEARGARVAFDGRTVTYDESSLDELALAYACSVHKSQGSEYRCVLMPIHGQHFIMLQRNLLYTALTRGRRLVILVGDPRALATAVGNDRPRLRFTRLAEWLQAGTPPL